MNKTIISLSLLLFTSLAGAHGGEDPIKELNKNRRKLAATQQDFERLNNRQQQLASLQSQAVYLQKNYHWPD